VNDLLADLSAPLAEAGLDPIANVEVIEPANDPV
jgi:hypothetical protein